MKAIQFIVFVIWLSLFSGLAILTWLLVTMEPESGRHAASADTTDVFAAVAGFNVVLVFVLRWVLLGGFRSGRRSLARSSGLACYLSGNMLVFTLSMGVGVLGFVNGVTSVEAKNASLIMMAGGLLLMLIHIPLPARFRARTLPPPLPTA